MDSEQTAAGIFPSVIIVSYNTRDLLLACIDSVANEACEWQRKVEIIVVDNASADGSPEAVEEKFPEAIVIRNGENLGFSRGNNIGIRHSKGDPVIALNSDTILMPGFFTAVDKELQEDERVGILAPRLLNPDGTLQISAYHNYPDPLVEVFGYTRIGGIARRLFPRSDYPFRYELEEEEHSRRMEVAHVKGACLIIRRSLLDDIGGFDEDYFLYREETDLCKRARDRGWKVVYAPGIYVYHHHKASSRSFSDKGLSYRLRSHYLYLRKQHGRLSVVVGYLFFFLYSLVMAAVMLTGLILRRKDASTGFSFHGKVLQWHVRNTFHCLR